MRLIERIDASLRKNPNIEIALEKVPPIGKDHFLRYESTRRGSAFVEDWGENFDYWIVPKTPLRGFKPYDALLRKVLPAEPTTFDGMHKLTSTSYWPASASYTEKLAEALWKNNRWANVQMISKEDLDRAAVKEFLATHSYSPKLSSPVRVTLERYIDIFLFPHEGLVFDAQPKPGERGGIVFTKEQYARYRAT